MWLAARVLTHIYRELKSELVKLSGYFLFQYFKNKICKKFISRPSNDIITLTQSVSFLNQYLSLFCSLSLNTYEQHFSQHANWVCLDWSQFTSSLKLPWKHHGSTVKQSWGVAGQVLCVFNRQHSSCDWLTDCGRHTVGFVSGDHQTDVGGGNTECSHKHSVFVCF